MSRPGVASVGRSVVGTLSVAMDDTVFDVDQAVIGLLATPGTEPATHGQDDESDYRQANGDGQEEQPEKEAERENANSGKHQSEPDQRVCRRLIESLPGIMHNHTDSVNAPVFLCHADDLVEGHYREFVVAPDREEIFLVATRHQGTAKAWLNICPHQGRPLNWAPDRFLTDDGNRLVCAAHGAVFEPGQGRCVSGPCRNAFLRPIDLTETAGSVFVNWSA